MAYAWARGLIEEEQADIWDSGFSMLCLGSYAYVQSLA